MSNYIIQKTYEKETTEDGIVTEREVITDSTNIHKNEEGTYIKIYYEKLDNLPEKLTLASFRFLIFLSKYADYADINDKNGGMLIHINKSIRDELEEKLKIKKRTFYDNLKNLVECDLLKKVDSNLYQLNPFLLGKGYFEYKANYKQGGIKDLRENWNGALEGKAVTIDDNRLVAASLKAEIEKLDNELDVTADAYEKRELLREKQQLANQLKKLSQTEYTKIVVDIMHQKKELEKAIQVAKEYKEHKEREREEFYEPTIEELKARYPDDFKRMEIEQEIFMCEEIPDYITENNY